MLTIDRPERRNAVDAETADGLLDGFRRFEADDEARVLVLTGAGPEAFCAGADLKAIAEVGPDELPSPRGRFRAARGADGVHAAHAVEADDRGDLRLVPGRRARAGAVVRPADRNRTARLGFTERRCGVPLIDGGTQRLPRIVGRAGRWS